MTWSIKPSILKPNEKNRYDILDDDGDVIATAFDYNSASFISISPDLLGLLEKVQGWLYSDLIHPDKPLSRDSAGKAYHEIDALINRVRVGS